jgi:hypothetical protein
VGATVRAASCHGWDDRGEKSKWDKNARNESHVEKMGLRKRENRAMGFQRADRETRWVLSIPLYTVKHKEKTAPYGRKGRLRSI